MNDDVIITKYSPDWPRFYQEERDRIEIVIGSSISRIEHIGSTAVPGLGAKPIIDILIMVHSLYDIDKYGSLLDNLGYEYKGEAGIAGRHFFVKYSPQTHVRTNHLHIVENGSVHVKRYLIFREYLRDHPEIAHQYFNLKVELSEKYQSDRDSYTKAKSSFVESILTKADIAG